MVFLVALKTALLPKQRLYYEMEKNICTCVPCSNNTLRGQTLSSFHHLISMYVWKIRSNTAFELKFSCVNQAQQPPDSRVVWKSSSKYTKISCYEWTTYSLCARHRSLQLHIRALDGEMANSEAQKWTSAGSAPPPPSPSFPKRQATYIKSVTTSWLGSVACRAGDPKRSCSFVEQMLGKF